MPDMSVDGSTPISMPTDQPKSGGFLSSFAKGGIGQAFKTAATMFGNATPLGKAAMLGAGALGGGALLKGGAGLASMLKGQLSSAATSASGAMGQAGMMKAAGNLGGGNWGQQNAISSQQEASLANSLAQQNRNENDNNMYTALSSAMQTCSAALQNAWKKTVLQTN